MNAPDEAVHEILCFLFNRYGYALPPEEQTAFVLTISAILSAAIDAAAYQALRRRLEYGEKFSLN